MGVNELKYSALQWLDLQRIEPLEFFPLTSSMKETFNTNNFDEEVNSTSCFLILVKTLSLLSWVIRDHDCHAHHGPNKLLDIFQRWKNVVRYELFFFRKTSLNYIYK